MYQILKRYYSSNNYTSNNYKSQIAYVDNNLYKRSDNRIFNNTIIISKHINQYTTDVVNDYETRKVANIKRTYYMFIDDVVFNEHNAIHTNYNTNLTKNT